MERRERGEEEKGDEIRSEQRTDNVADYKKNESTRETLSVPLE